MDYIHRHQSERKRIVPRYKKRTPENPRSFLSAYRLGAKGKLELSAARLANAKLVLAVLLVANASGLAALRADELDVGSIDGSLLADDAALLVLWVGLNGLLDDSHALDDNLALRGERTQDGTRLAAVLTGEHLDVIALLNGHRHTGLP